MHDVFNFAFNSSFSCNNSSSGYTVSDDKDTSTAIVVGNFIYVRPASAAKDRAVCYFWTQCKRVWKLEFLIGEWNYCYCKGLFGN